MKELEALNKMLGIVLAYRPPKKKRKKAKRPKKVTAKRRQNGVV